MHQSTDTEIARLIEESQTGNRDAFGQLVGQFQGLVTSVTLGITGDLQQSEDIAQETFLKAWTRLADLREPEKISGWLCSIARNLCRDSVRSRSKKPLQYVSSLEETQQMKQETSYPEDVYEKRLMQGEAMLSALKRIPEKYRQPLVLFHREELSIREIATALEISEDAVKQRLVRGRKYLRDEAEKLFEELLRATRPDMTFTLAVLASLPIIQLAAAQTVAAGSLSVTAATTATGKGFELWAFGVWLLNILYPALLLICVPIGVRNTVRFAPTLRIRRFRLRFRF